MYMASPELSNSFALGEVDCIVQYLVDSLEVDVGLINILQHLEPTCSFSFWKLVSPNNILKIIKSFKHSSNQDINGVSTRFLT